MRKSKLKADEILAKIQDKKNRDEEAKKLLNQLRDKMLKNKPKYH